MLKVLISDRDVVMRETISQALDQEVGLTVLQSSGLDDAFDVMDKVPGLDVALIELGMPDPEAMRRLARALAHPSRTPIAVLSDVTDRETVCRALTMGAKGYVPKTMPVRSLRNAVRFMAEGEVFVPLEVVAESQIPGTETGLRKRLSRREDQTLQCLCQGLSNKEIAAELGVQEVTAKLHVKTLCQKLGAKNRTHAAMIARDQLYY